MPARDFYHDVVKAALIADGWTITDDPLKLHVGKKDLFVDLGAERLLAADKGGRKIAVEVKSFPALPMLPTWSKPWDNTSSMRTSWRRPNRIGSSTWRCPSWSTKTCSRSQSAS